MTIPPDHRRLLGLAPHARGKRSPVTCELKCGNACAHDAPNSSANDYFPDVAAHALSRRGLLGAAGAGALALALAPATPAAAAAASVATAAGARGHSLRFAAIDPVPATVDAVTVPDGWTWRAVIRWGDPLFADAPEFDLEHQSAAAQEQQFGYNCDYLDILPMGGAAVGAARGQPRVHQRKHHVPGYDQPGDAGRAEVTSRWPPTASRGRARRSAPGRPWT